MAWILRIGSSLNLSGFCHTSEGGILHYNYPKDGVLVVVIIEKDGSMKKQRVTTQFLRSGYSSAELRVPLLISTNVVLAMVKL